MTWEIVFYQDINGREPLMEFLNNLPIKTRTKVVKMIDMLAEYGVLLKKTDKTPKGEIELAEKRMTDFIERCGGKP